MKIENFSKATDPKQYDLPEMRWDLRGSEDAPSRRYLRESLDNFVPIEDIEGKKVIDIGSGTGHLFNWLRKKGASDIQGIDPSNKNTQISTDRYPWATSHQATLREFSEINTEKFDIAFAILVIEHIEDLGRAFDEMSKILTDDGKLILVMGDKDDELSSEMGQDKHIVSAEVVRQLEDSAVEVKVTRKLASGVTSTIYDILRPIELVKKSADASGFEFMAEEPIMNKDPLKKTKPMCHILSFVKR